MTRRTWQEIREARAREIPDFEEQVRQARLRLDLGQFVYDLRHAAQITQAELAQRMHTTQSAIARLEGGEANPSIELLHRLGTAVGARLVLTSVNDHSNVANPVIISEVPPGAAHAFA